jgi:site-specific DNA-cytosine methylase
MADKDNKSKLTYHVWDKDNNEYDIPDEVVQQRGMDNFAKDFEGGYITMFDDKKQKVDVPIEDVGEYRKQGYIWYDTSGNATPINEVGKKPSPSSSSQGTEQSQYPQEVLDAFNSPDNKPGNFKDLAQLNDEYQRGELKKPSLISQALGMMPKVDAGNIGREQKMGGMITNMLLGDNMQQPQDNNQQVQHSNQENAPATEQPKPTVKDVDAITGAAPVQQVDAIYNKYVGKGDALSETMYDLMASGQAQNQEEAQSMAMGAMNRAANRLAQRTTDEFVSKLGDTVEGVDEAVMNGWHSHAVQDNLKKMASQYGIMNSVALDETGQYITQTHGYDQFINGMVKPAMVESLVKKYGENYRKTAEDLATRLYSNDEVIQNQLMNQDIDEALSSVISKYVNPSVVEEYNKAQEEGSKAFNKGMEGSQNIPASLRLGTAIASQYEANQAKDPQKTLSALQKKFNGLYKNPQFLNDMSNAAFKVMQRYGMNGTLSENPKQFKPMIDDVLKAQLNRLEVKNMIPKGSAEYIMNTGLGNTIVGKITRKLVQTDYQNWLEDIANQQYQPGFWERVGSGALTFAGDAWSYWLPGAAGGKVTKSMLAKAEGRLASDLMAKGMEAKMAERAAKVLIGKSKGMALKTGAAHGAVTFGGQSAISKPIDEIYRTGQLDENGKVYNPSVGKILANTLGEVAKQSAVGAIMQGGTIANMVGKGRGLATNILVDVGGKVVDSSIMTGQQMLERMAQDPSFKPTGKDAAESFLESMANLTSIGLPGMVGKYARFKDAKEFNRKFDFNDQDIAELKRFGYDDLRDAFEKLGINGYRADGEGVQMMGQLTDKYMNLMNDKSVPEVLKAKMMAVVEGKRPSSFSPVIDSIIVQPMDNDGKVYLETLNKDGGIIDRKEYSSLEEAQKAEKKLDFEKSLNITSEYEKAYHTDALQDRLNTVYEQARDKYAAGEQLSDEDKAAIYLHQNASAIGDIMQKQQKGMELTEQEQQMVNSYRHFYDSAFENSPIMKEYVRTFEDSQGVEHGTLRKALEGDGKSRTAEQQKLVEEYQKQLYNDIVLKREMNDAKEQMNQNLIEGQRELPGATQEGGASAENAEATAEKPVDASVSSDVPPTEPPTPPVGGETPTNAEGAPLMETGASPSDANTASNESKSNAYVMGQNAYQNGDAEGLKAIDHNDDVSKARLKRAFGDDEAQMNVVVKAYEDGKDMEQFVAQRANSMTTAQQDAVRKYVEAQDAKKGVYDALQHADDGYGDALKELLWTYQTEDGNIVPATLTTGQQVFLKKANEYGGGFVVVPDEQGQPTIKQVSSADIKEVGTPIPLDDYINQKVTEQKNARQQHFFAQYDGSGLKPSDTVQVAMEAGEEPMQMTFAGYSEDGKIVLSDGKDNIALTKDEFNSWRQNALDSSIGAELDAEDVQRANDEADKAEADKKQRYNEGIVGLGMGQPDYSSKDTEPKVAAEYLQEQFGNDHGKLMNLISGSRSDIKEQLDNKRKAASEYEDWLSLNADLDPEKAQKVENDLALVNEQIADLETRYKNWNAIRKEVMTPEEARTLKNERKAEIEKAGVDENAITSADEREVAVLDNKELKKQYPTMDEASNYIASERKRIYHIQNDEVQPQIDGINEALEQYMNDDIDYSVDQLKELNTTKAQLEARQANLSASAKDLKAQDKLLNTLYRAENKEERAKAMEELTPSEQRKVLVADALKKNDLGVIKEIYKDASVDVMDLTPQTLEEAVSESLSPHSLNPESLQYELGKSNFKFGIGKRYDSNKFNYLIAKKGTGMSVNEFAVRVFNDLPVNLQDMGYSDQDVRNTLLDMFKSYDNVKDMRNVVLMNRIAAAEEELSSEEEYYEAQKEREIIERQAENPDYYAYLEDNSVPLPSENELNHIAGMEYDRMMEIENREREYKQYVKSILPELADYDDRSNEEGYGGGSSLGSDSSRRGVDEGNRNRQEGGSREASAETETGALHNSTGEGRQEISSLASGEGSADRTPHLPQEASFGERLKNAIAETEPNPSEAQKKAGNYKKGHLSFGGYDFTVETPKGTTRSGKDEQGKPWSVTMHDTYGYILGKIGVDGDHIDMFINDAADLDSFDGNVYVVDQVNPETGEFDEHKVMYGYPSEEAATEAYLANYSKGWKGLGKVTAVPKATFDKWLESSDRKTKPFADYAMIKKGAHQDFISDMEYTYENDVHPSEEDKPKMQKFAERLLDFHQDREDKPEYGYTMLSSNINGDKLYPSEKKWFGTKKYRQGVSWVDKDNVCAYELNPRFNARGYLTAVGVHKLVPIASFDRDVKEVKPSEMTEAQKVAFDAVSTMLKKAGIPVKVVSNEDMEKVAEAQDNLNLAMLLNHPEMRFKIKTPEEKQAAENAYNFAKELRPNKWAQYAVVDMSNPNKMPEYYQKQELARKERTYLNRLMWGNYKVFNLDKSFEDNVAGLTGSFPSEFDPYKIDEQTNKRNELKKQIKETEEAYKLTGQERVEYQNLLMKEYMDEHGLASENDIPDNVWNDCRNKSFEKYQNKLDSLFAKYKDLDRQLKSIVQPGVRFLRTYHGTGASFSEFDFDHMGEGEGSQAFGWGGYVTSSKKIGKNYATLMDNDPSRAYYRIQHSNGTRFAKKYPTLESFLHGDKQIAMNDKFTEQEKIDYYNEMKKLAEPYHNLYEVDIPDDNGSNYLDWDKPLSKKQQDAIREGLEHLGVDIKKLESKGQSLERTGENVYNSTLYIGLTGTEYDLPEITKGISKFLSSVGFTGIKYKAGRNFGGAKKGDTNYVIFKPEDMKIVDRTKFAQNKGVVYGYTDGKEIVLNQEHLNPNTPIHEYQHLWRTAAKEMNPELIAHGDELIKQTQLFADLKEDSNYKHLSDDEICDEAFARLTGEDGAAILEQMAKDAIKENPLDTAKELTIINRLKNWLKKFWYWTLDTFTKWKPEDIKKMTLEDIRNLVLRDLAQGVDPRTVLKGQMTKDEAVSLRQQMADNAEPERILEHTEDNWLQDFGKDGRVNTPIGSIKLGENQYKKAGREDRIKRFGLLKPTLERPDVILEKPAPKEGAERQTKYLFVKSFKKVDGTKILNFESITVKQGEDEVSISAHQIEPSKLLKELTESKMLWNRFRGDSNSLGENQGSALTPSANNPSGKDSVLNPHSDAKIRNSFEITKENGGNLSVEDKIKAVSQQFGVDEADVAMYANAIKKGSTAEAARARANIKRHLMQVNEGNIFSFKDVVKYTKPINEALKENFGDLDAMIEERRKQVEAERNAMEAARKRAEEEEAKRKKHLEELSLIPDDKLDKQYMDALAKGDDATAREMLDEASRRKGYDDTESAYQGVGAWAAPGNPGYESDKARRDDWESSGSDVNLEDMALGYTPQPDDYFSHPERYSQNTPHGLESVKAINTAIDAIKNGEKDVKVKVYRAVPTSVKEGKLRNGDWVTPSKKYAEMHGTNRLDGKYRIIEDEVPATQLWWDGNDANEFGFDDGKEYKYKNAKNNRKLNDLVTYDDEGDVIPPSKRFNSRKSDIRFMFAGEKGAAEADKAEEQTIRMDNLDVAKQMEEAKKDAKAIKLATGWERGADGKWRYEMPDAKIKDMKDIGGGNIVKRFDDDMLWNDGKLTNVIDAPELFEAYPQLKDVRIDTDAIMNDMPSNGNYNAKTNTITIHADELKYMNSILNHEIQHAIQYIEGFGKGGSPEQMEKEFKEAQDEWKARAYAHELEEKAKEMGGEYNQSEVEKALVEEYKDLDMSDELPDKETRIKGFNYFARGYADRSMDDTIKRFRLNESTRFDFDSYKEYLKLAGEVESRNVEKRLGMTDEERRNSLASETEDVNRDEQIVMNGNDASYSIVKDPETIKKLDKEDTVKVYRAMQVGEDGKLYPPMAAKVKGKFVEPIELGKWEQADERPELADDKGMFTLNKGNGKSLKAAYNPYLHTSRTPLNDQFSEAQNRPNIVTVEVEVPKSELTSGYKADKAKDAVGEVEWKAGIIQGQLTGKRKVVLSRWDKPVRIVPDSEVADVIVNNMFKGKNITMPSNVVTPSLRKELEKRGVPFVETDNRGRIVGGENDGVHYSKVYGKNAQSPILEQKLKKHPDSLMKAGTYFSGGGLVEEGLKGIIDPVVAVEYDRKISGVYRNNFGQHIVTADVRDVDPKELVKHIDGEVEYFHASPVCKNYSQAKSNGGEVELDKETAKSTADFIDAVKPRVVTIENVKGYKDSEAMKIITQALDKNGYKWDADVYNAADFGGYTSRERLIVRAVKEGELPEKPKKQPRKGGWLEAVADILPTLTEKKNGVAPWMDTRLKADGIDWQKVEKPLYVMGSAYADGKIPHAYGDEILPTLRTKSGDVIIMPGGKVLRADGRVLARITGLGDDYLLPKTESLAHTIIGNGIPVQLTKGVIAPLLNKDDLSGRNVLARLGSSIFKNNWDADMQKQVSDRVVNTANKLGGAEATVYTSVDEVPDAYLSDVKNGATGWYDPTTHTVHVYLPNCADADEAQRTVFHEKIGHEGMEVLLGGEQGVRKFADFVYKSVDKKTRGKILDFANKYDPGWSNPDRINVGTQEYIAHLAEEGPTTAEDFSLWTKIKHYLIKVLKKLGIRVPGLLNDKDLRYYLMKAGKALHVWDNMPKEKQEAMMAQASNAEIKDALADGAGKGKPHRKKGEGEIAYIKRKREWEKWKIAREDTEDPEPPMFYDFDKDAEGKKEWERLNKEWRDSHHLHGDEMPIKPERKEGETDEEFFPRYKEWEKWNDAMTDKENPMPDMFSFEKKKQDEARANYEKWLTRHELNEQNNADLDLYEGKIYPAETNPEADALEQRVMQDLAEVTSTDVSKEGAATTVKHAVIHRRKNMEEASADDAIYINDVKSSIEKMAESGAFDKLLSDYQGKPNKAEKLAEAIPYIIEAPRRIREIAYKLNSTGVFGEGHIHITPDDVEAIQELRPQLAEVTAKKHTELKDGKEVELFDDMNGASEVASKMADIINGNHEKEPGFVPIDGTDILNKNVLPIILNRITPYGVDYKNLSEPMKSVLDSIRDWYNYTFDWLKDNNTLKADTGFTVDYVNHLWDKEKSDKNAYAMYVENRQRTKSPNEKPRQINTIMEGLEVGLVPKTTDITKMMAYYSRSNIEAWANKTMLQEVSGLNVIERNEDGEIISSDPLLSSVAPFNLEQYKYFEIPGVGPVWVYNVSPKQMKVKNPITGKDKVLYSEASAGDRFGVVFDTYQSTPFWKAFDTMASSMKKLELGFSGFHAGALTEVYMVQNMVEYGPKKALANFMKYIFVDTMKNHQLPCFANPQDFQEAATHLVKFGATNDYAAADVQNMFDNWRDFAQKLQQKLEERGKIGMAVGTATIPFEVATQMFSMLNKGMDVALWDFLHDGLKLATYRMRADRTKVRAKKYGWTDEQLGKALDEDGQFVNDMFGGQHWDVLGASHRTLRYAGRVLLSPDWNASTTRHFLALTGFGSVWNEATFENFKNYYKNVWAATRGKGKLTPDDWGRLSRQLSALLCYGIGFMIFYEGFANAFNAAFRALDEEKERKKAEEIRKTNPNYRSPYELAYPDGMKWYDYLMRGNSLGQQSKIFMGRYADGTEMYIRHGKQFREVPEYLFNHKGELEFPGPMVQRMIGKANPMVRMTLDDINYLSDFQASHADQEIQRKYGKTIGLLYKDALYWAPFLIPSQENKEFKAVDFFFPSSKGFSPWKAQSYFKDFILSGDMEGVVMTYLSCERNGIDPEEQIKAAIGSVKALESAEMKDGITSLQVASERFDEAKSITEKKKMRQKMKKFLSQSEYKAFTQKEALDMVQSYLNGEDDLKEMEKAENKYLMKAKSEDVTEDWRIQAVWNGTMETYDEYLRLKDVDKAKANAFKNSKTNKRLFAARKAISAAKKKMNKAKKQMNGQNDAAKMVEIRKTRKELIETLNGME